MTYFTAAHLQNDAQHEDVLVYLERIQSTMDPYEGRFVVHGAKPEVVEGSWPGYLVVIAFPDEARAKGWYDSDAYQEILPMRTDHIAADVIMVPGVPDGYDPARTAARLRTAADAGAV
ncbi:hypothetical protein DSC45_20625 [Streptomyces sp. YIM 130001]|uniref:DUF1330 domain-containing protein n=1 Tax=Streptomyces sp. YIM 130001 TaxID=2259644 RepID=UPI000E653411|nr:DUF1330 domain-containing protein [Streptomyces sp. YIM 130001]RII14762.1 hypothetical protein DSC45_20625 [Streptomyces sp. YIM 130001]